MDSLGDLCVGRALVVRTIFTHYSNLSRSCVYSSPFSYNRFAFVTALTGRVLGLFWGREIALGWVLARREQLWRQILEKARPRCVIGIQPGADLCRAAKVMGIPVYDLQHGAINDDHLWYGEKYRIDTPSIELPAGFLCWDEPSALALRKWASLKGIDVRVIGNLWFLRFLFPDPNDCLVTEAVTARRIFNNNRPVIVVSLQWGMDLYYKHPGFNGVMVDALEKVILETADSYNWLLRLHPVQLRGVEKEISQSYLINTFGHIDCVDWSECSEMPLPVLFQQVDLHITDISSIVIEAAWMGVYSALLNENICPGGSLENIFAHERAIGIAEVLPQNQTLIRNWIALTLCKGKRKVVIENTKQEVIAFIDDVIVSV